MMTDLNSITKKGKILCYNHTHLKYKAHDLGLVPIVISCPVLIIA